MDFVFCIDLNPKSQCPAAVYLVLKKYIPLDKLSISITQDDRIV